MPLTWTGRIEHKENFTKERLMMILTANQALEVGEALLDAAQDARRAGEDHAVVMILGDLVAVAMKAAEATADYGYVPLITVTV